MKALIVLGGDAPGEALLRAQVDEADFTVAADRGLEAFVRCGLVGAGRRFMPLACRIPAG